MSFEEERTVILLRESETREKQSCEQAGGCASQLPTSTLGEGLRQPVGTGEACGDGGSQRVGVAVWVHCGSSLPGLSAPPFPPKSRISQEKLR